MGKIVLEDFNGDNGYYKINLAYLNKNQVEEVESLVSTWNPTDEDIKSCIRMCLTDADEQRFKDYDTNLKDCLAWLEKQKEPLPIPDKFSGLKSLMLQYLQSAANRKDDTEIESDTDLWGRKILDYVWKYSDEQKEQNEITIKQVYKEFINPEKLKDAKTNKYIRAQLFRELAHNGIITAVDYQYLIDDNRKPWTEEEYLKAYRKGFDVSEQLKQKEHDEKSSKSELKTPNWVYGHWDNEYMINTVIGRYSLHAEVAKKRDDTHGYNLSKSMENWLRNVVRPLILEKQNAQKSSIEEILTKAGLNPYKDGNQWCILAGDNIQEGICGFGDTIEDALYQFLMEVIEKQKALVAIPDELVKNYKLFCEIGLREAAVLINIINGINEQKEQKPLTTEETELNSIAFLEQMGYTCIPPGKEQNPAEWSEFDEDCLKRAIWYVENPAPTVVKNTNLVLWLQSLPERFNLQLKQAEFNDNDDQLIGFIFDLLNTLVWRKNWAMSKEECLERLKSLRPQQK